MEIRTGAREKAGKIQLIIFDVDGVLTDGGIYVGPEGELFKPFNCKDGLGITLWHRAGRKTAVITGRSSAMLGQRAAELKITAVWQGKRDKRQAYRELKEKFHLRDEEIAYIGDDLIDLPVMLQAGLAAAPADAVPDVLQRADLIAGNLGGHGAVREILEFILQEQNKWQELLADFLQPENNENNKLNLAQ